MYSQVVKFHIYGNAPEYDFTSWDKAIRNYNNGKLVLMYVERTGYMLTRNVSLKTATCTEHAGLTPKITTRDVYTFDRKNHALTADELRKLRNKYDALNESDGMQYTF